MTAAIPKWAKSLKYWGLIHEQAPKYGLDPLVVAAVIQTESIGNTYAVKYEPHFSLARVYGELRDITDLLVTDTDTMEVIYRTSWGLMQVMGAVFYEHGGHRNPTYAGRWATSMLVPEIGIKYGCTHLKLKQERYGDDPERLYAAYNAGSPRHNETGMYVNQRQVDRFMRYYRELTDLEK